MHHRFLKRSCTRVFFINVKLVIVTGKVDEFFDVTFCDRVRKYFLVAYGYVVVFFHIFQTLAPKLNPAPTPANRTVCPAFTLPNFIASLKAIPMLAEPVFPISSTLVK